MNDEHESWLWVLALIVLVLVLMYLDGCVDQQLSQQEKTEYQQRRLAEPKYTEN